MDSLKAHPIKTIGNNIRKWLNHEWRLIHEIPDSRSSLKTWPFGRRFRLHQPKVPLQDNGWDCGVFVCRYAFGIIKIQLRGIEFTHADLGYNSQLPDNICRQLITRGSEFQFNLSDIARIRVEFKTWIERLSVIYVSGKEQEATVVANPKPTKGGAVAFN
jgi:Ulp1 family protease